MWNQWHVLWKLVSDAVNISLYCKSRGGRDRRAVGFTTTYAINVYHTKAVSSNPVHGEVYSIQYCVIKFVSDLRQFGGFHRVFRFPLPIKLAATKYRVAEILLKVALNIITLTFILQIFHIKGKHLYFWLWVYLIKVIPQTRSFVVKAFY